jgi:hypothetical protein
MIRTCFKVLLLAVALYCSQLDCQSQSVQQAADIRVQLHSATGSNRFQLGEMIPVEVLISSSTPNRYLEPCKMFWEGCFGYPQCRFATRWLFEMTPGTGWTDIGWHGCSRMSGGSYEVKSSDLTNEPKKYPYMLTSRFRFDTPGNYTVRLSLTVGLDDDTNQFQTRRDHNAVHNSVSTTADLDLEILPAADAWKSTVLEQGIVAWTGKAPAYTKPPSPDYLESQRKRDAFCNLGTPEAAIAFADLLSQGIDTGHCLSINSNKESAKTEMHRLLVDSTVGVRAAFFAEYVRMREETEAKPSSRSAASPRVINEVREALFGSLPKKSPEALIVSLETLVRNPMAGYWVMRGSPYDLRQPFTSELIALVAADFDRLSPETQAVLLDREWEHVRSPLMLPVVRRKAEEGDGHALLRWQELEPAAATAFMRSELLRPAPRFSSLYIRLPDVSLRSQEQQIATRFVELSSAQALIVQATLLHRYATPATLPTVLPFIDQHLAEWTCDVQVPVLAYLLKVSPNDAGTRLSQLLPAVRPPYCPRGEFLSDIGFMQASPVLDAIAQKQIEDDTGLADDAAMYLRRYGSAAMKPMIWAQLSRWHKKYAESGAEFRVKEGKAKQEDYPLSNLDTRLRDAYVNAHGWTLSPDDLDHFSQLFGLEQAHELACTFSCGSQLSVGPGPGNYYVYGRVNDPIYPPDNRIDYLMPTEPYQYQINQYGCRNLKSLEEKLLQFPAGSKFSFADTGSGQDAGDWASISLFLRRHGYLTGN